jgi:hypothetical protein
VDIGDAEDVFYQFSLPANFTPAPNDFLKPGQVLLERELILLEMPFGGNNEIVVERC